MRFRLRYLHHDLELSEGQFAVGRNASCQLSLDDPLVSRRHALLTVSEGGVTLEDLSSRNGVLVNGDRIIGKVSLSVGDRIMIGSQELTLLLGRELARTTSSQQQIGQRTLPKVPTADEQTPQPRSNPVPPVRAFTSRPPPEPTTDVDAEPSMIRRADAFNLLGSVADKALAMGRVDEAERLVATALTDLIEEGRKGKRLSPALVDSAAKLSSRLASATTKGVWADYVIELYALQARPCPAQVIDELYTAYRKVNAIDLTRLRNYLATLRDRLPTYGPAERFLFQRIEGLERLAALR